MSFLQNRSSFARPLCALAAIALFVESAQAVQIDVTPANLAATGWAFTSTDSSGVAGTGSGVGSLVPGPATPPLGVGSASLKTATGEGDGSVQLRSTSWTGTPLADITSLGYSTYGASYGGDQLPYFTLYLNTTGGSTVDDRLIFEPVYSSATAGNNNPNPFQPNIAVAVWQNWDALNGQWYSDNGAPASTNAPFGPNGPGSNAISFQSYLAAFPNATIVNPSTSLGGIRFASGFSDPSDNYDTNVDAFTIGVLGVNTTYNFEPIPEPGTIVLLGLGLVGLVARAAGVRRRNG